MLGRRQLAGCFGGNYGSKESPFKGAEEEVEEPAVIIITDPLILSCAVSFNMIMKSTRQFGVGEADGKPEHDRLMIIVTEGNDSEKMATLRLKDY